MKRYSLEGSLWAHTAAPAPETEALEGDARADVVVVGGGYTGLSTALHLAQRGVDVAVLEAEETGFGGSGRNAGHCSPTFLHADPAEIEAKFGPDYGQRFIRLQGGSANLVFDLIDKYGIECEAARNGLISPAHTPSAVAEVERRYEQYKALGKPVELWYRETVAERTGSDKYYGAWFHPEGGHLNPLGYARGLARAAITEGARVFTDTPVTSIRPESGKWRAATPRGSVLAEKVVIATNAYGGDFWPRIDSPFYRLTVFSVATQPLSENLRASILPGNSHVVDTRHDTQYYKFDGDGRIVSGSVVIGIRGRSPQGSNRVIERRLRHLFPQLGEVEWGWFWYGYIAMNMDMLPRLHELAPGVATVLGYSGRGVPTGTAMGGVLADLMMGVDAKDLDVRPETLRPLNGRRVLNFAIPNVAGPYYRWLDRRDMRRDGLTPPVL
jgi:glycine/D-amino acid oxidase-like deaminating enzyme